MTRKSLMIAAVALIALTSSISTGTAEAHWYHGGYYGWGYHGWGYHHWWPGYRPYYGYVPACWVTVYGTTVCR